MQSRGYHLFFCAKIDDVMDHQAKVWSSCSGFIGCAGHDLGQVGQVPNLTHKILTILPHPIFSFSELSCPIGHINDTPLLLKQDHICRTKQKQYKVKKITFVLGIYKSAKCPPFSSEWNA